jgi:ABC-type microcin C transport system duplicated ATPase subunit YejF
MSVRVASSRLIGRSTELADLEAALADAADERPSLAFVAGESGVGKTRLLEELMRRARERGPLVLAGETVAFGTETDVRDSGDGLSVALQLRIESRRPRSCGDRVSVVNERPRG